MSLTEETDCKKCKGKGRHRDGSKCGTCAGSGRGVVVTNAANQKSIAPAKAPEKK